MDDLPSDTGLVTATVNPPEKLDSTWDVPMVAALCHDLAVGMYDEADILQKHGLTTGQYAALQTNEFFIRALEVASMDWRSVKSTERRLALEAATTLEKVMPIVGARMLSDKEDLGKIIEGCKMFAKMAGVGEQKTAAGASERFTITIDLGADTRLTFDKAKDPRTIEETARDVSPVLEVAKGPGE